MAACVLYDSPMNANSPLGSSEAVTAPPSCPLDSEHANLLQRLQERFFRVVYRPECSAFEIGDVLLLTPQESMALLGHSLCRTSPWM